MGLASWRNRKKLPPLQQGRHRHTWNNVMPDAESSCLVRSDVGSLWAHSQVGWDHQFLPALACFLPSLGTYHLVLWSLSCLRGKSSQSPLALHHHELKLWSLPHPHPLSPPHHQHQSLEIPLWPGHVSHPARSAHSQLWQGWVYLRIEWNSFTHSKRKLKTSSLP